MRRDVVLHLQREELSMPEGAALLGVSRWTLRRWKRRWVKGTLGPNLLGRPRLDCTAEVAHQIHDLAEVVGAEVSTRYVRERLGWLPRAVVEREVRAFKREFRREQREGLAELDWVGAGRAWVCDWTEPDAPIDGVFPEVLVVRDLGASRNLLSLPVPGKSGQLAAQALAALFQAHGAPLALKTDGGSEFAAKEVKEALSRHRVAHLVSPSYYPPYNGAIEAGIGSIKTHAWHEAARHDRAGSWTCDDVEAGRLKANETARPWGPKGPSPDQAWKTRSPISEEERAAFLRRVSTHASSSDTLTLRTKREIRTDERHAIERSLEEGGYLVIKRGGVPPGVSDEKGGNI